MKKITNVSELIFRTLSGFVLASVLASSTSAFQLVDRWTRTATDGTGIALGDPITLTWGFVPNGTPSTVEGPSNLISFLDNIIGSGPGGSDLTQRPWFTYFEQSFERWSEVTGLSYVYEPNDDGATHSSNTNRGILGTRADVRIAGSFIDGNSQTLAFNFFPDNGDMTLDTGDTNFFGSSSNNYRGLRNVVMHEHGHGIGLDHVVSNQRRFLMEPFIDTGFDGPQFDDILGAQRGYGDVFEKSNNGAGNDTAANATDLGLIGDGGMVEIGRDGRTPVVAPSEIDFVSIDDNGDTDFFAFNVDAASQVTINLEPVGPTYNEGPVGGSQSSFDTSELSNLTLALFDTNGSTQLAFDNSGGLGQIDQIADFNVGSGEYFVRVKGIANSVQMFELEVLVDHVNLASPDFNMDGQLNCLDIDALVNEIVLASTNPDFDLDGDGSVDPDDVSEWLVQAGAENNLSGGPYLPGDANLDGAVDLTDLHIFNNNKESGFTPAWCLGDFNASGSINAADFDIWNTWRFQNSSDYAANVVPEPAAVLLLLGILPVLVVRRTLRSKGSHH